MAKKVEIELDVKGNVVESTKNLKAMKAELKTLDVASPEFKKLFNDIDDLEDKIKGAKKGSSDWIDSLEQAGGPLGALGAGLNKAKVATTSFGTALKATGIGLVVAAIGGLVAAFAETEGAMKKLDPLIIGFQKILGGIFSALEPLIDAFLDLAMDALPYVTKGISVFYSSLVSLFTLIKTGGGAIAKILKGIFTLDMDTIKEGYADLTGTWDATVKAFDESQKRFDEGSKKITKKEKENTKERKDNADKELQDKIKQIDAKNKLADAELEKAKAIAMGLATTEEEKAKVEQEFAQKAYDQKKKQLEEKQALYKKGTVEYEDYQAQLVALEADYTNKSNEFKDKQTEADKKRREEYKKALEDFNKEVEDIKIAAIKDETKKAEAAENKRFQDQRSKVVLEMLALGKTTEEMNQVLELLEQTHQDNLTTITNDGLLKKAQIEKGDRDARYVRMMAGYTNDVDMQRTLLEAKKLADDEYYASQLAKEGLTAEQIKALNDKKLADQIEYTNKSADIERQRVAVKQKALDDITTIFGAESDVGKAALIAKQILMAKELVMEISKTITFSTQAAARSAVAVAEGTAQTAKIGFPQNIPMLIGYAAQAVAIIMAIKSAVSSAKGSASAVPTGGATTSAPATPAQPAAPNLGKNYGAGGMINGPLHAAGGVMINAEGGEAIMTRGAVTKFAPLLSALNVAGGGTSFSRGAVGYANVDNPKVADAANNNPMIVKTYVVTNDLTTAAQKQARLKDLSTL